MRPEAMTLTLRDPGLSTGRQKLALAAIVCLPVPVLAGSGLAIPLPPVVYRVAVAVADGAHVVAVRLPGVGAVVEDATEAPRAGKIKLAARELAERPQHTVPRRGASSPVRARAGAASSGVHSEQRRGAAVLRPRPPEEAVADAKPTTTSAPAAVAPASPGEGAGSRPNPPNPAPAAPTAAAAAVPVVAVTTEPAAA